MLNWLKTTFIPQRQNDFRPEALAWRPLFFYNATILILKIAIISLALTLPGTNFFSAITAQRLGLLINQVRQAQNLSVVNFNDQLNLAANLKASDMAANGYFEHVSPAGVTPWHWFKQAGYNFAYAGENLAMDFSDTDTVFAAWMQSPSHRANILNKNFNEMGLAVTTAQIQNHQAPIAVLTLGRQQKQSTPDQTKQAAIKSQPTATTPQKTAPEASSTPRAPMITSTAPTTMTTPPVLAEQIQLQEALVDNTPSISPNLVTNQASALNQTGVPMILGAFISKSDQIAKSLYIYFTLLLALALLVNIFVKIRIQRWPTIIATTATIALSALMIFI